MTIAGCKEYCKDFTVALKLLEVFNKKQMYVNVITGKENVSEEWTCVASMFLTSFNIYLCLVMHVSCVHVLWLLSGFFYRIYSLISRTFFTWNMACILPAVYKHNIPRWKKFSYQLSPNFSHPVEPQMPFGNGRT